jgi:hypothetical protein
LLQLPDQLIVLFPPLLQPIPETKVAPLKLTLKLPLGQVPVPAWAIVEKAAKTITHTLIAINFFITFSF